MVQTQGDVGVFRRVFGSAFDADLLERNLFRAFSGYVFVMDGAVIEIEFGQESMSCRVAVLLST